MGRARREYYSSLSIDKLLAKSKEEHIVEVRRQKIERLRLTEWRVWKLLRIDWK